MLPSFYKRSHRKERLDTGEYTTEEYELWLKEARWINRRLGDASALRRALREFSSAGPLSLLDAGAGSGEMLKIAREILGGRVKLMIGAEMSERASLEVRARRAEFPVESVRCNVLTLPFADDSVDVVMCSLVLHHLSDEDAVRLLTEMDRVARFGIIAIDLHRHPLAYLVYRTLSGLFLQPMTVEDGSLSILRSYRPGELRRSAELARLRNIEVRRSFPFRLILTAGGR